MGGIAWNTENMYFNTFITNEIYADVSQENPPVSIKANMKQIDWGLKFPYRSIAKKTPKSTNPISEVQEIKLCPYGCARLRMTEMPILQKQF